MNEVEDHYIKDSPVEGCQCSWCKAARDSDPVLERRMLAKCRNCEKAIVQTPAGDWIPADRSDILGFCVKATIGQPPMRHQPMPDGLVGSTNSTT